MLKRIGPVWSAILVASVAAGSITALFVLGSKLMSGGAAAIDTLGLLLATLAAFAFALVVQAPIGVVLSLVAMIFRFNPGVALASAVVLFVASFVAIPAAFFNLAEAMVGGNAHFQDAQPFSFQSLTSEWPVYVIATITSAVGGIALGRFAAKAPTTESSGPLRRRG